MVARRPLLAAWSAGYLYLYEFNPEKGFIQTINRSITSGSGSPFLAFMRDSTRIFIGRRTGTSQYTLQSLTSNLETLFAPIGFIGSYNNAYFDTARNGDFIGILNTTTFSSGIGLKTDETITSYSPFNLINTNSRAFSIKPDESFLIAGGIGFAYIIPKVKDLDTTFPLFNADTTAHANVPNNGKVRKSLTGIAGDMVAAGWANTVPYAYIGDSTGAVYSMELVDGASDYSVNNAFSIILESGYLPFKIKVRADDKYVAINTYNSTAAVYRTFIYKRMGYILNHFQTITNFGKLCDWSEDGSMLIDASTKRLFKYDMNGDTFVENSSLISNVASGVVSQAMSFHQIDNAPNGYLYTGSNQLFASRTGIDLANLKLMLLDSDAVFNAANTHILDISPANEIYGNGWPQGGKLLSNVSYSTNQYGRAALVSDPIEQILTASLTFSHAVLYDVTSNKPLIWYQMKRSMQTEKEVTLRFDLSPRGVVQVAP